MSKRLTHAGEEPVHAHRRLVRVEVALPTYVELIVGTNDEDPDEHSDWEILDVVRTNCDTPPRQVGEHMHDADFEALSVAAFNAKDLP